MSISSDFPDPYGMNRSDLVNLLAERFSLLNHRDAESAVDLLLEAMTGALANGQRIEIRGFGSFSISRRAARTGRNPRSGEALQIPERRVPHFKPGKSLREAVADESSDPEPDRADEFRHGNISMSSPR